MKISLGVGLSIVCDECRAAFPVDAEDQFRVPEILVAKQWADEGNGRHLCPVCRPLAVAGISDRRATRELPPPNKRLPWRLQLHGSLGQAGRKCLCLTPRSVTSLPPNS